jgi:plasmid maintenance system antidote protein VapI
VICPPRQQFALDSAQFWLHLQGQYEIGMVEREKGVEIARRVRPADAA